MLEKTAPIGRLAVDSTMYLSSTSEVRVESSGNDVSYVLPPRSLGNLRWLGLFPVGISLFILGGPLRQFLTSVLKPGNSHQSVSQFIWLGVLAVLVFFSSVKPI